VATPAPGREADDLHWSEHPWVRAIRGGRGRPLGLVVLLVALGALLAPEWRPVRVLRLAVFDAYQFRAPRERVSGPAVIVDIDEASLTRYGQWPWPRTLLARLVELIGRGRPAAIGLDIFMPEPDRLSPDRLARLIPGLDPEVAGRLAALPENDSVLASVIKGRPVVLGVAGIEDPPTPPGHRAPVRIVGDGDVSRVRRFPGELRSVDVIDAAAAGHGLVTVDVEGGVVRGMPAIAEVAGLLMPTLGIEMLRVAAGEPAVSVRADALGVEAVVVGDVAIPTQPDGSVWIHYTGPDPTRFVSAAEVLSGAADLRQFEKKLVLVGATALAVGDYQATPVGGQMSGVEIHAQLIEGIVDGDVLSRPWWTVWLEAAVLAAAGGLLILAVPALPAAAATAIAAALAVGTMALSLGFYFAGRILFDAAVPIVGMGALFTVMLGTTLGEAQGQRRALRRQVARQREIAARLAGELEAARRIQMGSLPTPAAAFPGETRVDLYAFLAPAREVGGDLYDFFKLDADRIFLLVGDVSGKGLPSSLFMAVSKSLCKSIALRDHGDVGSLMRQADREISRDNAESLFVTVWAGIVDAATGDIQYGNAGHDAPYLLFPGRPPARLSASGGPPLCVLDEFPYEASRYRMRRGEILCLATDGVTEATSAAGEFYGRARLEALLAGMPPEAGPDEVGEAVRRDVERFAVGVEAADDLALLILRWNGP
jgi:serine phosphatase RsbU (regulator of sigma subunit)/CHASE2 domain-containing sensor protein